MSKKWNLISLRVSGGILAAATLIAAAERASPQSATDLLDLETLDEHWTIVAAEPEQFRFQDGLLHVDEPAGWLRSNQRYGDFRLTAEFRFLTEDADSGLFLRADPSGAFGRGWPANSYQVQLRNPLGESPFPPVGGIFRHGTPDGATRFDEAAARRLFSGTGEWQTIVIEAEGDELTVALNGELITEAAGLVNPAGFIGIQAETGALEFRSIEIEPR